MPSPKSSTAPAMTRRATMPMPAFDAQASQREQNTSAFPAVVDPHDKRRTYLTETAGRGTERQKINEMIHQKVGLSQRGSLRFRGNP